MLTSLVLLVFGAILGNAVLAAFTPMVTEAGTMSRDNYRGKRIPVVGGIPVLFVALTGLAVSEFLWAVTERGFLPEASTNVVAPLAFLVLITGLFGLVDDAFGTPAAKGIRGHMKALARGRLTSGMVKLVAGVLAALVCASMLEDRIGWIIAGTITVAAWTNVGNLLDLGPGRAIKGCAPIVILLVLFYATKSAPLMLLAGCYLGLLRADLGEKVMLGDSGSNPLGALVGLAAMTSGNHLLLVGFGVAGLLLNLAAEKVSFSRVIAATGLLRYLDLLGATPERRKFITDK